MKTALVAGGSRGIGKAIVSRLSGEGWRVVFSYHQSGQAAEALARESGAYAIRADLAREADADSLVEEALRQLGHLDAMVYCAGVSCYGLVETMGVKDWDALHAVNLRGAFLVSRRVITPMAARKAGSMLFISSMWGQRGAACEAAYAASKAGLIVYAISLAQELGLSGIRVNCLAPGVIDTDMLSGFSGEELRALADRSLLKRIGTPEETARAAAFLLDDRSSYITGQVLNVDGGFI